MKKSQTRRRNGKIKRKASIIHRTLTKEAKALIKQGNRQEVLDSRGKVKKQYLVVLSTPPPNAKSAFHPKKIKE